MHKIFTLYIFSFVLFLPPAFAQPSPGQHSMEPKKIYENNYANEVLGKTPAKVGKGGKQVPGGEKTDSGNAGSDPKDFGFVEPEKPEEVKALVEDTSYLNQSGTKVVWVGAVLNSNDTDHLIEKLDELAEEAIKYDLMIGPVFLVGNTDIETALPHFLKLQKRKGKITYVKKIPTKYEAVKMSPTWIMQTPKGQILLEALGPLRRNLNKNGELVLPEQL